MGFSSDDSNLAFVPIMGPNRNPLRNQAAADEIDAAAASGSTYRPSSNSKVASRSTPLARWSRFQLSVFFQLQDELDQPLTAVIERFAEVVRRDFGQVFFPE